MTLYLRLVCILSLQYNCQFFVATPTVGTMNPYVSAVPLTRLGEGPHWNASKQELYYADINGRAVHRYVPETREHTRVHIGHERVTLVVPVEGQDNKYVISVGRTLQLMKWDGKSSTPASLTSLFSVESELPQNRFNDGKCDAQGRLWAGTMDECGRTASLYLVTDTIKTAQSNIGISNGIAWNHDDTLMYYIDTTTDKIDVFDFNFVEGTIDNRRTVYDFSAVGESGIPDGMSIDTIGNLWVACWGGSQVIQVDPNTGKKTNAIRLPTKLITSIAFGGPNLDVMYVTSEVDRLSDSEKLEQAAAGSLFQITNSGSRGMAGGNGFRL